MEYANSLIKRKTGNHNEGLGEDIEESWTFIGDDNDPELVSRIHAWEPRVMLAQAKEVTESPQPASRSATPLPFAQDAGSK
jgi:sterol 3beta-glucosyltransferase